MKPLECCDNPLNYSKKLQLLQSIATCDIADFITINIVFIGT